MEFIIGVGNKKTAQQIVSEAEKVLRHKEGVPRKIICRSSAVEIMAERANFESEFESFTVRARAKGYALKCMESAAQSYGDVCSLSQDDGWHVLKFPSSPEASLERALEGLGKFSEEVNLPEVWRIRGDLYRVEHLSTELIFKAMVEYKASDIHLSPGQPAYFRVDGDTHPSEVLGRVSATQLTSLIREIAPDKDWKEFEETKQASFNYHQIGLGYSRVSCFVKAGSPHLTFRFLPETIPSFEELHIPRDIMETLAHYHHGLVLVVGMTGSGKSTTVASVVDYINTNYSYHVLTIENPVEYVHKNKKAIVSQRDTGIDVATFGLAVTGALRHDPDTIVIGEMRDPDTIRSAINAAATGHLVISTLHSNTAYEVVNRIVSFFDPIERDLVKLQLRDALRCVVCQRLIPKIGGGRVPAIEVLFNDIKAINDGIIEGDTDGIRVGMQQTVSHSFLFESYLLKLYKDGKINLENARLYCTDVSIFDQMVMGTYTVPRLESIKAAHMGH
ncbi:MAG: hypothetical protein AMXMBFR84_25630 [Candidatus Hydrogenedentota bacterium]